MVQVYPYGLALEPAGPTIEEVLVYCVLPPAVVRQPKSLSTSVSIDLPVVTVAAKRLAVIES